jgi:hypothetical protein
MKLITLDSIVRAYILERNLVWHDYFKVLVLAQTALKEIGMDVDIAINVKADLINVDPTNKLLIPLDCTQVIGLYIENGDKVLPISRTEEINPMTLNNEQGDPIRRPLQSRMYNESISLVDISYYFNSRLNDKGEYLGRSFGFPSEQPYQWQQFGNEIRLDVRINTECVLMIYNSTGLSPTVKNVVHPLAEETIKSFLDWKFIDGPKKRGVWEGREAKNIYYNEKRKLYGRIHGLVWDEYIRTIRELQVNAAKY